MTINSLNHPISLRLFLFSFFIFSISILHAQKPKEGDWLTEVGLSAPLGGGQYFYNSNVTTNGGYYSAQPVRTLGLNTRYFKKPNMAYRTGLNLGLSTYDQSHWTFNNAVGVTIKQSQKNIGVLFGIEKHLRSLSNKFSPFCFFGATANYYSFRANHTSDSLTLGINWGFWNGQTSYTSKQSSFNVGIIGLLGFDYWITGDIYLGVEYGINCDFQYSGSREQTLMKVDNNRITSEKVRINKPYSNFNLGNYYTPYIRLGWRFYKSARLGG